MDFSHKAMDHQSFTLYLVGVILRRMENIEQKTKEKIVLQGYNSQFI